MVDASPAARLALSTIGEADSQFPGIAGVPFKTDSVDGVTGGPGAHACKNGALLPNDNVDT